MAKKKAPSKKAKVKKLVKKKAPTKKSSMKRAPAKKIAPKKKPSKKASPKKTTPKKTSRAVPRAISPAKKLDFSHFVTPLDDRLLVKVSGAEKRTPGGLYIPDTVADVSGNLEGYVVAVGRGHMNKKGLVRPMDVNLGDRVVFSEYAGSKVKIQNEDLVILRESDVMGVVSK